MPVPLQLALVSVVRVLSPTMPPSPRVLPLLIGAQEAMGQCCLAVSVTWVLTATGCSWLFAGSMWQGMTPVSSEGGSPCSGTLARQEGSTPEALNPTITYIPYLSSIHLLPQHSPILDPHPLPTVAWTGTLGAWRTLSWAQGLSSWDSPCAELPQLGTALSGNQIFTSGHLAATGLGERERLLCQNTPVVPPGRGSCRG